MENLELERLRAAADMVDRQSSENPSLGIPVDPDVAEFMGAFYDAAAEADAAFMEGWTDAESEDEEPEHRS